jgi:hypothetical protein
VPFKALRTENRIPKAEGNPKPEARNPSAHRVWSRYAIRITVFGLLSGYGLGISRPPKLLESPTARHLQIKDWGCFRSTASAILWPVGK